MVVKDIPNIEHDWKRGGLLDLLAVLCTLNNYGVEHKTEVGYLDENTGEVFKESPIYRSMLTRKAVHVSDMSKTIHVSHRIVKIGS